MTSMTREEHHAHLEETGQSMPTVHPNSMMYYDEKGVKHEIYIPARDYYKSNKHFINEEWDELAKFPKYTGQGYTEADYITDDMDPKTFYSVQPPPDDEEPEEPEKKETEEKK